MLLCVQSRVRGFLFKVSLAQIHRRDAWGLVTEGMRSVDDGLQCLTPLDLGGCGS